MAGSWIPRQRCFPPGGPRYSVCMIYGSRAGDSKTIVVEWNKDNLQTEVNMCKSAIPNNHVIYAMDIGVYEVNPSNNKAKKEKTTFAWARLESAQKPIDLNDAGKMAIRGRDMNDLCLSIDKDLTEGKNFISIGFEAPMWFPIYDAVPIDKVFKERFNAEKTFEWYKQSGAAATLKAISLGVIILSKLKQQVTVFTVVNEDLPWTDTKKILIYEAFVAGEKYKHQKLKPKEINSDEWDAVTAVYSFYKYCYVNVVPLHKPGSWNGKVFSIVQSIAQRTNLASDNYDCTVVGLT